MAQVLDSRRIARTGNVAAILGRDARQLSRPRGLLLREGFIIAPERGEVAFNVPYLAAYVLKDPARNATIERTLSWRL